MRRVFEYHGAEHKANFHLLKDEKRTLTVENMKTLFHFASSLRDKFPAFGDNRMHPPLFHN